MLTFPSVAFLDQLVGEDLLGAKFVSTMDHRHVGGDVGKIERFLDGGVTAADDRHRLVPVEEPITGCASRHTAALVGLLGVQAQVAR